MEYLKFKNKEELKVYLYDREIVFKFPEEEFTINTKDYKISDTDYLTELIKEKTKDKRYALSIYIIRDEIYREREIIEKIKIKNKDQFIDLYIEEKKEDYEYILEIKNLSKNSMEIMIIGYSEYLIYDCKKIAKNSRQVLKNIYVLLG